MQFLRELLVLPRTVGAKAEILGITKNGGD